MYIYKVELIFRARQSNVGLSDLKNIDTGKIIIFFLFFSITELPT